MDWILCHRRWITLFGIFTFLLVTAEGAIAGWKKTPTQYHIQTDEGNERYFRYQTYNGQYRKERRLDDGTVIGSYGWVDPSGYLRMTDYIADAKGYRVVKELMEYVGTNSILDSQDQPKYSSSMKHSTKVSRPHGLFKTSPSTTESTLYVPPVVIATTPKPPPVLIVYGPPKRKKVIPTYGTSGVQLSFPSRFGNRRPSIQELNNSEAQEGLPSQGEKDVFQNYATPLKKKGTGFIYKIPHQYHKEETERDGSRQGSFGYVDPFGIRRVIHYDADNAGFQAVRDFKYVGRQY